MTNREAIAYMILAMKRKGYSLEQIQEIEGSMLHMMDINSESEAKEKAEKIVNGEVK